MVQSKERKWTFFVEQKIGNISARLKSKVVPDSNYNLNIINEGLAKRVYHGITKIMSICD